VGHGCYSRDETEVEYLRFLAIAECLIEVVVCSHRDRLFGLGRGDLIDAARRHLSGSRSISAVFGNVESAQPFLSDPRWSVQQDDNLAVAEGVEEEEK